MMVRGSLRGISRKLTNILDAGTTDRLAAYWVPLDEFTKDTIAGLSSGDMVVATDSAAEVYKKYGAGTDEAAIELMKEHTARLQGHGN
jgi:hypothetical protein